MSIPVPPRKRRRPGTALRQILVDSPGSVGAKARARRWRLVETLYPDLADMKVIDLGGTVEAWRRAPVQPAHVTVVNLFEPGESDEPWLTPIVGDACAARRSLREAGASTHYDLVFSNSLLEHVGGHARRVDLAAEVRELAPMHWVQTPNRYFVLEPHWLFPGMQFMPTSARAALARTWPLAHTRASSADIARQNVMWTELVGTAEMRTYFPDSEIRKERLVGLTKSLIAVRRG